MKTIVLVSIPGAVLSLDLGDFPAGGPVEGRHYEFDGKIYRVIEIIETLGTRTLMGVKVSGNSRLLSFADTVSSGDESLKVRIITPKPIGLNAPEDVRSKGGIIIGQTGAEKTSLSSLGDEPVHIVFVVTEPRVNKSTSTPPEPRRTKVTIVPPDQRIHTIIARLDGKDGEDSADGDGPVVD